MVLCRSNSTGELVGGEKGKTENGIVSGCFFPRLSFNEYQMKSGQK